MIRPVIPTWSHVKFQKTVSWCECRPFFITDTTQSLNVSKDERNYTIRGLAPAKYRLWVGAVSDAGRGPSRQIEFMIYKKQNCKY